MSDMQSETQTSTFETSNDYSSQSIHYNSSMKKKKKTKLKPKVFQEVQQEVTTARKQPKFSEVGCKKVQNKEAIKQSHVKNEKKRKQTIIPYSCCEHTSVYQRLFLSIVLSFISLALFRQPPKITFPLAEITEGKHEQVFQIVTQKKTRIIQFNHEISEKIAILLSSTKSARVKATVNYTLGYKFKNSARTRDENLKQQVSVSMGNLEILSYSISDIILQNREDGLLTSWSFQDYEKIISYIKQGYIEQMKKQELMGITDQKRKMHQTKAEKMLSEIFSKYQTWFDWLLRRIDQYIEVGLAPYVKNVEIIYKEQEVIK